MKPFNYYTQNIATIIEANKSTGEQITIQFSCGGTKTNHLNLSIDCAYALRVLVSYVVKSFRKAQPILLDNKYSINLEYIGYPEPMYVSRWLEEHISSHSCYVEAVKAITAHKSYHNAQNTEA